METGVTSAGGQADDGRRWRGGVMPGGGAPEQDRIRAERAQCWLARLSFVLAGLAVVVLLVFAGLRSVAMLGVGLGAAAVSLAAAYSALSHRRLWRWLALAAFVAAPVAVIIVYAFTGLLWVALVSAALWLLAATTARSALAIGQPDWRMPELAATPPAAHPFLIMNPRSGGGKVGQFDLKRKAEALGARVFLMSDGEVDVAAVADEAIAAGADLLGVAGGDGTQGLVAGIAARHGIPFLVITAGTRNHFALDLGLDRDDPATCLDALSDGVDLLVDLGEVGGRTFVNNASFGAYAEVVDTPAYRGDKLGTTLDVLPDMLQGQRGSRLMVHADEAEIDAPQALLVANNPYGTGDLAGLSRRARLDRGVLSVVAITIESPRQAAGLFRGRNATGVSIRTAQHVTVTATTPQIPVGIDGEAVSLPTPIRCAIRPAALRVRVPRHRPGVRPPKPPLNWAQLRRVAALRPLRRRAAQERQEGEAGEAGEAGKVRRVTAGYERFDTASAVLQRAEELAPRTMIIDVEPLVAWWDTGQEPLDSGVARTVSRLGGLAGVSVLCFATNSARRPSRVPAGEGPQVVYLASAGKPLQIAPYQSFPGPGVVIGDQLLTDGLLARRLGYAFLHYCPEPAGMPIGPRLLRYCGWLALPFIFARPRGKKA